MGHQWISSGSPRTSRAVPAAAAASKSRLIREQLVNLPRKFKTASSFKARGEEKLGSKFILLMRSLIKPDFLAPLLNQEVPEAEVSRWESKCLFYL